MRSASRRRAPPVRGHPSAQGCPMIEFNSNEEMLAQRGPVPDLTRVGSYLLNRADEYVLEAMRALDVLARKRPTLAPTCARVHQLRELLVYLMFFDPHVEGDDALEVFEVAHALLFHVNHAYYARARRSMRVWQQYAEDLGVICDELRSAIELARSGPRGIA